MEKRKPDRLRSARVRLGMLLFFLPKIPFILRIIIFHLFRVSEPSNYLDLRCNVTVSFLRNVLAPSKPMPVSKTQALSTRDPGIKGRIWVSTVRSQVPPEDNIRATLLAAIDSLKKQFATGDCRIPDIVPVEAEWTGYRANATPISRLPAISEKEKYSEMMKECKNPNVTVLYFHGGAYYLCDPATHRSATKKIAKLTGGRVYSVRYRLAPQNPFPSALLDALASYFTLLYPPPGSIHDAVAAGDIVLAGDSAGGNLSLALLQTLLEIRRQNRKVTWFGDDREVPLPAGIACNSPWLDMVQSLPSWTKNRQWDYLPPPDLITEKTKTPADSIWPAQPPRKHIFIDDTYLLHPLANLQLNVSWEGAPPVYMCCGWECLSDEIKYLAKKLTDDGVTVVFEEYEAMPHVFAMILSSTPQSKRCMEGMTRFIMSACEDPAKMESSYTTIKARTLEEVDVSVEKLSSYSEKQLRQLAFDKVGWDPSMVVEAKL